MTTRGDTVPGLPLWQPWASLVVAGAKRVETRSWPAGRKLIGQRVAIHATKTREWLHMCAEEPFNRYVPDAKRLPLGALIGTVVIDRCSRITHEAGLELLHRNYHEFAFGDYTPGRFAWVLRDPIALDEPVPFRGRQGVFDVPAGLVGLAPAQERLLL